MAGSNKSRLLLLLLLGLFLFAGTTNGTLGNNYYSIFSAASVTTSHLTWITTTTGTVSPPSVLNLVDENVQMVFIPNLPTHPNPALVSICLCDAQANCIYPTYAGLYNTLATTFLAQPLIYDNNSPIFGDNSISSSAKPNPFTARSDGYSDGNGEWFPFDYSYYDYYDDGWVPNPFYTLFTQTFTEKVNQQWIVAILDQHGSGVTFTGWELRFYRKREIHSRLCPWLWCPD